GFLKLLRAWKGSVYKLMYKELLIFVSLYAAISLTYRLALTPHQKRLFESFVLDLQVASAAIPLSFVLGFYVTFIVQRWWQQFTNVPWPDRTLFIMCTYLQGKDDRARIMRRSVARYMLFGMIIICRSVSVAVMKRFPTIDHIVEAGFITKDEANAFENVQCQYLKFWVPLMWANNILVTGRKEGKIQTDFGLRMIIQQLADFRDKCSLCFVYDWITVPLVYTQVVTFAVYSYFAVSLVGQQYLDTGQGYEGYEHDCYIPGFTILQFLFYMGWLKVAEQMINPFGEDDDDYDINWLLDRHTAVAFALVDQCSGNHPPLMRDAFWNDVAPDVPYTESSLGSVRPNFLGSTFNVARPSIDVERLIHEDELLAGFAGRAKSGSISGSLMSLLPFRNTRPNDTAEPNTGSQPINQRPRFLSVPKGRQLYQPLNSQGQEQESINRGLEENGGPEERRVSIDVPVTLADMEDREATRQYRSKTLNEYDAKESSERQRKLSLPLNMHFSARNKQRVLEKSPGASPKTSRFTVETVPEEEPVESEEERAKVKSRRQGQANIHLQGNGVSRVPILSSIEEGNTVTSMSQIMPAQTETLASDGLEGSTDSDGQRVVLPDGDGQEAPTTSQEQEPSLQPAASDHSTSVTSPLLHSAPEEAEINQDRKLEEDKPRPGSRRRKAVAHITLAEV
ncbi:Bestrophin homolog, partial [Plakobranchus ocellatus]